MGKETDMYFRKLSLSERVKVVKEYVLSNDVVLMKDLYGHFGCQYYEMGDVIDRAGFCLLPRSWHTGNRVLKSYRSEEGCVKMIAEKLGVSKAVVYDYIRKLSGESFIEREVDIKSRKVNEAYKSGLRTCAEIGKVVGMTTESVWYYKKKLGLPSEKVGRPIDSKWKVVNKERNDLILSGDYSVVEIARREKVSRQAICDYIIRKGLKGDYVSARERKGFKVWKRE